MFVPLNHPFSIVVLFELLQSNSQFLHSVEVLQPEKLFLQSSDETFGTAVGFGLSDKGRTRLDSRKSNLFLEGMGSVLASMVMPERKT
jgi:hypothetical protein